MTMLLLMTMAFVLDWLLLLIYVVTMGLNFRLSFLFSSLLLRRRLNFYHPPASIITILIEEVTTSAMNDGLVNGALTFLPSLAGLYLALKNKKFRQVRCLFTPHNCDVYPPRPSPAVFITSSARTKEDGLSSIPSWWIHLDVLRSILHSGRVHRSRWVLLLEKDIKCLWN